MQFIPLDRLVASKFNVRRVLTDVAPLAASLAADGVIQNLVVVEAGRDRYSVIAGERRRRAALHLVEQGVWAKDCPMPCDVRLTGDATALSLAENAMRIAMHPADAYRAFARLEAQGTDETAIAARFGYAIADVRRLLTLGRLSPKALKLLADDRISVETAQVLTLTVDHALQEEVARQARGPSDARRLLTEAKMATSNRLFTFLGADAYESAGGTYTRDLFTGESVYADDAALVRRLVREKLDALGEAARGEGWFQVITGETEPSQSYGWYRLHPENVREATFEEAERRRQAEATIAAIEEAAEGRELVDDEYASIRLQRTIIDKVGAHLRSFSETQRASGILVLSIGYDGTLVANAYPAKSPRKASADKSKADGPGYPSVVIEELSKVRTLALQRELCANPDVAIDLLTDALLAMAAGEGGAAHAVRLRREMFSCEPAPDFNAKNLAAPQEVCAMLIDEMPRVAKERFEWLRRQDDETKRKLLGFAAAVLVDGVSVKFGDPRRLKSANLAAAAVKLDMREHWHGSQEFFARLSKKVMLEAVEETLGSEAAAKLSTLKKAELASACAEQLSSTDWLPQMLREPA